MKKIITIIILVIVSNVFAQGPVYNFHFYNGEVPEEVKLVDPAAPAVQSVGNSSLPALLNELPFLSIELGLVGMISEDNVYLDEEQEGISSDSLGPKLSVLMRVSQSILLKAFVALENYTYDHSYSYSEVGSSGSGSYSSGADIVTLGIGIQKEKKYKTWLSMIGSANLSYMFGTAEIDGVDEWGSYSYKREVNRWAFDISAGPEFNLGKNFYANLQASVGVSKTGYYNVDGDIKPTFGSVVNFGVRI